MIDRGEATFIDVNFTLGKPDPITVDFGEPIAYGPDDDPNERLRSIGRPVNGAMVRMAAG